MAFVAPSGQQPLETVILSPLSAARYEARRFRG